MKKIFQITLIALATTIPFEVGAIEAYGPASTQEMQRIQQSSFERLAPRQINESYEKRYREQNAGSQAQEQINEKLRQIENAGDLTGQVYENKVYVQIQKVVFPKSAVFTDEELQQFAAPLIGKTLTVDELNKVIDAISKAYVNADYFTSRAYLPI